MKTKIISLAIILILLLVNGLAIVTISEETSPQWPSEWLLIDSDPEDSTSESFRDVQYAYYNIDDNYIYFRLQCYGLPNFSAHPESRYKWFIDTDNPYDMYLSGGSVYKAEYLLFVEDSPKPGGDGTGEIYFLENLNGEGGIDDDYSNYLINPGPTTDSNITGFRIDGNYIDMYISRNAISDPPYSVFSWATDMENPNLDQAPNNDKSDTYWDSDISKADLSIVKTASSSQVYPGDSFYYTLNVTNHGPHEAINITVNDVIPSRLVLNSATPTPTGTYPDLYWEFPSILAGNSTEIILDVTVDSTFGGIITNTAVVYNDTRDPLPGNNEDSVDITVLKVADLCITKTDSKDPVIPGEIFTYDIQVTNLGPHDAENVTITDILPAGLTYIGSDPVYSDNTGSVYTWDKALLESGEQFNITITVEVDNIASTILNNTVQVSSDTIDLVSENNDAYEETVVGATADLSIVKTDDTDPVYPGESFNYTIIVTNNGPDVAADVEVTDLMPAELHYLSSTPSAVAGAGGTSGSGDPGPSSYKFELGNIGVGESKTITIEVEVYGAGPKTITNTAEVNSTTLDLNSENDIATEDTFIGNAAELSVTKTCNKNTVIAGENITYTINVTNHGPNNAENITVIDVLPSEVTFLKANIAPDIIDDQTYQWNISTLEAYQSVIIVINVSVKNGTQGTISNQVTVTSDTHDTTDDNNDDEEETDVKGIADLSIEKTSDVSGTIYDNTPITYTLKVTNHGPDIALDVNITDILPNGVTFDSSNPTPTGNKNSEYYWLIPSIEVDETVTITINVTVNKGFKGILKNIGYVEEYSHDPEEENDQDSVNITVEKKPPGGTITPPTSDPKPPVDPPVEYKKPTAILDGPYFAAPGEKIQFDASQSHDNDEEGQSIVSFDWKFSEEDEWHVDLGAIVNYTYSEEGEYKVYLRVFDNEQSSNSTNTTATIVAPNIPPGIPEIIGPNNATQNTSVNFTIVSEDPEGKDIKYIIDWGDGNTTESIFLPSGVLFNASHKWLKAGNYTITVKADDNKTASTEDFTIEINEPEPKPEKNDFWLILLIILLLLLLLLLLYLEKRRRDKKNQVDNPSKDAAEKASTK